jgi:hypothetical protein
MEREPPLSKREKGQNLSARYSFSYLSGISRVLGEREVSTAGKRRQRVGMIKNPRKTG